MKNYKNINNDSTIVQFESGDDYIDVKFKDGWIYKYTHKSAGPDNVEAMQKLANQGYGLQSYISKHVRKDYVHRLR